MTSRHFLVKTEWRRKVNKTIAYCKPNVVVLGSVAEMICATRVKGPAGVIEAVQWHIQPAYDLNV